MSLRNVDNGEIMTKDLWQGYSYKTFGSKLPKENLTEKNITEIVKSCRNISITRLENYA